MIDRFAPDAALPRQVLVEAQDSFPQTRRARACDARAARSRARRRPASPANASPSASAAAGSIASPRSSRATVDVVRERGGEPRVVPVMGNHGGATDEGQAGILEGLGVTEATVGAPIHSAHGDARRRPHAGRRAGPRRGRSARGRWRRARQPRQAAHRLREPAPWQRPDQDVGDRHRQVGRRGRVSPRRHPARARDRAARGLARRAAATSS